MLGRRPIRRSRTPDRFRIDLGDGERELVESLAPQLRALLGDPDQPGLRRLFPPAFSSADDAERQEEYVRLMQEDLVERHAGALEVLEVTARETEVSGEQLDAWVRALNQLRLVLGSRLDVTEDDDDEPDDPEHHLYHYLGYLQQCAVEALVGD